MRGIFVFIGFILGFVIKAQDYKADMQEIVNQLSISNNCTIASRINVFNNATDKKNTIVLKSTLLKSGEDYRTQVDQNEVISNEKYIISVDHEEKTVEINPAQKLSKKDKEFLKEFYKLNEEDNLKKEPELIENKNGLKTYLLSFKTGEILTAEITLNTSENRIEKVTYYYHETAYEGNAYVEIVYTTFDIQTPVNQDKLLGKDIVIVKGKNCTLEAKYADYTLVNNLKN